MSELVYFSSASGNTKRFIEKLGMPAKRIPITEGEAFQNPEKPFVLVCPTYADGNGKGAVPEQVISLLKNPSVRDLLRGVIASGNRNFGHLFACSGDIISRNCRVPILYKFELAGTPKDINAVSQGLHSFWLKQ